ncbi:STAS domain-containing protein [Streptomyces sp. G-G2]|uniref:STAS domain-containing protein n=1 Tax=Streptomyces sp. G-G2 TaxID=3046201 RepID=UPI0024B9DF79|nr:STAS domain-containing protein [Streptomyces sp. G-G2]MDJ0386200.1 STAS domain-containing protein [Streptomyces sp. G-G2]
MTSSFSATATPVDDTVLIIAAGEMDADVTPDLDLILRALPAGTAVVLDMTAVTFMDIDGLRLVLSLRDRPDGLLILGLGPQPRRLLELAEELGLVKDAPEGTIAEFCGTLRARAELARALGRGYGTDDDGPFPLAATAPSRGRG